MNLIIDAGNTYVKLAVFEKGRMLHNESAELSNLVKKTENLIVDYPKIEQAMVSSVVHLNKNALSNLSKLVVVQVLGPKTKAPFKNLYATPKTLGVDRIALAAAAYNKYPNQNSLIIDAGTCVTYDMINNKGEYLGGSISPGINMRYKALHNQTSKLPHLSKEIPEDLTGNSTESSIHSGVVNGICCEIDGIIDQYSTRYKDLTVILTGGDAQFLSKRLKNTIFAQSKFLLEGLNYLLDYNKR